MAVPDKIKELIETFDNNIRAYHTSDYKEAQLRNEFVNPFFVALGWDVHNEKGYAPQYMEVEHEASVKIKGKTKAADYAFRVGGDTKFFLETKKPSVNIKEDKSPAFQIRNYAWNSKNIPLSILTDFEEFAVYDCRIKPAKTDKASKARIFHITYLEYEELWEEIASVFSRDAVLKGNFDRFAKEKINKREISEVDSEFLKDIESWRELLAKNIAIRNPKLDTRELNFAVQKTIDRLIFLQVCEDRGIENLMKLEPLSDGENIYPELIRLFRDADDRYNSGLFHFKEEKNRAGRHDVISLGLTIDDKPLKEIIKTLCAETYDLKVIPVDILGHVYEQFLGKVIRLTPSHRAVVEEKPEVKKAGGVYYTPTYIVDYIVENTVGKLLDVSTPRKVSKLRILDPACGSGSFLLGAYKKLINWHIDYYVKDGVEKHKNDVYQGAGGKWKLSTTEKKRILLNNIYGVDIDSQAVEVTKLNLLLRVLEDESEETINAQLKMFHERALPDLGNNIKCGNSLIGPDFYENEQMILLDDDEKLRVNVFDWEAEFGEIMAAGGFDVVIGNPPYIEHKSLKEFSQYFHKKYETYKGTADIYVYFYDRGLELTKNNGFLGFISSNKFMKTSYGENLRGLLSSYSILKLVDFTKLKVFQALVASCIMIIQKNENKNDVPITFVEDNFGEYGSLSKYVEDRNFEINYSSLGNGIWQLFEEEKIKLKLKIENNSKKLGELDCIKIFRGVTTGYNDAFIVDEKTRKELIEADSNNSEIIKPLLQGRNIKKWFYNKSGYFLLQTDFDKNIKSDYPVIYLHLEKYTESLKNRDDQGKKWWNLRACAYYSEFEKEKIIWGLTADKWAFTHDNSGHYLPSNGYILTSEGTVSIKYILSLLNSKLMEFYFGFIGIMTAGGAFTLKHETISSFPVKEISHSEQKSFIEKADVMLDLHKKLNEANTPHEKTALQRQIDATDKQIDSLVNKLYNLTDDEIRIVEESLIED